MDAKASEVNHAADTGQAEGHHPQPQHVPSAASDPDSVAVAAGLEGSDALYFHSVSDLSRIRVGIRVRPLNEREQAARCSNVVMVDGTAAWIAIQNPRSAPPTSIRYTYDNVFDMLATQPTVFAKMCQPAIQAAFQGINSTIFAYGQTGSGKTWTMRGILDPQQPHMHGVVPNTISHIFAHIKRSRSQSQQAIASPSAASSTSRAAGLEPSTPSYSGNAALLDQQPSSAAVLPDTPLPVKAAETTPSTVRAPSADGGRRPSIPSLHDHYVDFTVRVGFVEVYNEDVYDLLAQDPRKNKLSLSPQSNSRRGSADNKAKSPKQDVASAFARMDAHAVPLKTIQREEEAYQLLYKGDKNRSTSTSPKNEEFSRSHAIFIIEVDSVYTPKQTNPGMAGSQKPSVTITGRLNLVNLAGSEKQRRAAGAGVIRLKENTYINQSLTAVHRVLVALVHNTKLQQEMKRKQPPTANINMVYSNNSDNINRRNSNPLNNKLMHVSYRDSKLTQLLQSSMGGECYTALIACISPADDTYEESISTLRVANNIKQLANKAMKNTGSRRYLRTRSIVSSLQSILNPRLIPNMNSDSTKYNDNDEDNMSPLMEEKEQAGVSAAHSDALLHQQIRAEEDKIIARRKQRRDNKRLKEQHKQQQQQAGNVDIMQKSGSDNGERLQQVRLNIMRRMSVTLGLPLPDNTNKDEKAEGPDHENGQTVPKSDDDMKAVTIHIADSSDNNNSVASTIPTDPTELVKLLPNLKRRNKALEGEIDKINTKIMELLSDCLSREEEIEQNSMQVRLARQAKKQLKEQQQTEKKGDSSGSHSETERDEDEDGSGDPNVTRKRQRRRSITKLLLELGGQTEVQQGQKQESNEQDAAADMTNEREGEAELHLQFLNAEAEDQPVRIHLGVAASTAASPPSATRQHQREEPVPSAAVADAKALAVSANSAFEKSLSPAAGVAAPAAAVVTLAASRHARGSSASRRKSIDQKLMPSIREEKKREVDKDDLHKRKPSGSSPSVDEAEADGEGTGSSPHAAAREWRKRMSLQIDVSEWQPVKLDTENQQPADTKDNEWRGIEMEPLTPVSPRLVVLDTPKGEHASGVHNSSRPPSSLASQTIKEGTPDEEAKSQIGAGGHQHFRERSDSVSSIDSNVSEMENDSNQHAQESASETDAKPAEPTVKKKNFRSDSDAFVSRWSSRAGMNPHEILDIIGTPTWFLLRPGFKFQKVWIMILMFFIVYNAIIVPMRWSFGFLNTQVGFWFVLDWIGDACGLIEIFIAFRTGFFEHGALVLDTKRIASRYIQSWFLLDIIAAAPLDLVQLSLGWQPWARINKLVRFPRLILYINELQKASAANHLVVQALNLGIYFLFMLHYIACCYFALVSRIIGFGVHEWVLPTRVATEHQGLQYLNSFYWAIAISSGVSEGAFPHGTWEVCFTLGVFLVGLFSLSYIIATIRTMVEMANTENMKFRAQREYIAKFMEEQEISADLKAKVMRYYSYLWASDRGYRDFEMIEELPSALRTDMKMFLTKNLVSKLGIFEGVEAGFISEFVDRLTWYQAVPGDCVARAHDKHDTSMYIIHSGEMRVMSGVNEQIPVSSLSVGDIFGENTVFLDEPRIASICAVTHCHLLRFRQQDLDIIRHAFPNSVHLVEEHCRQKIHRNIRANATVVMLHSSEDSELSAVIGGSVPAMQFAKFSRILGRERASQVDVSNPAAIAGKLTLPKTHWTVQPQSPLLIRWGWVTNFFLIYNAILIPYRIAFDFHLVSGVVLFFDYLGDVLFMFDIALRFRTAFLGAGGTLVEDLTMIRRRYTRSGWFIIHVFASIPLDFIMCGIGMNPLLRLNRLVRITELLRPRTTVRMLRLSSVGVVDLVVLIFGLLVLNHWMACCYYLFALFDGYDLGPKSAHDNPWLMPVSFKDASTGDKYLQCMYWGFTHLTSLGRTVAPQTEAQLIFSIIIILGGIILVAYVIGSIVVMMQDLNANATHFNSRLMRLRNFMRFRSVPEGLWRRTNNYYDAIWTTDKGVNPNHVLMQLPVGLQHDLLMELCGTMIREVNIFREMDDAFIESVVHGLRLAHFPAGEYIVRKGDIGEEMYFIANGRVAIILDEHQPNVAARVLNEGDLFGEGSLFSGRLRGASVVARTSCRLLVLDLDHFKQILDRHPQVRADIAHIYVRRQTLYKQTLENLEKRKKLHALTGGSITPHGPQNPPPRSPGAWKRMK